MKTITKFVLLVEHTEKHTHTHLGRFQISKNPTPNANSLYFCTLVLPKDFCNLWKIQTIHDFYDFAKTFQWNILQKEILTGERNCGTSRTNFCDRNRKVGD